MDKNIYNTLYKLCYDGNLSSIKDFIENSEYNISTAIINLCILEAASNNQEDVIAYLKTINPNNININNWIVSGAIKGNHFHLIKKVNRINFNMAIIDCCSYGNTEIFEYLYNKNNNLPNISCYYVHSNIVKYIIEKKLNITINLNKILKVDYKLFEWICINLPKDNNKSIPIININKSDYNIIDIKLDHSLLDYNNMNINSRREIALYLLGNGIDCNKLHDWNDINDIIINHRKYLKIINNMLNDLIIDDLSNYIMTFIFK
jgi:hypothetical protein